MGSTLTINANLASLTAQRRLGDTTGSLQRSLERLSSGLRINKASDDAAGLAIASLLNVDARVYTQAVRNTNDALSAYSIGEGAITSLVDIVTRLKELAQQSANGVMTTPQRSALDAEGQALYKEYNRIVATTQFNGQDLIDGSLPALDVQTGYDSLSLPGISTAATPITFSAAAYATPGSLGRSVLTGDFNGDGVVDLATVGNNLLSIMIGNGDGSFKAGVTYAQGSGNGVDATGADLNGDGRLDIIVGSAVNIGPAVKVFLGNGDGTFKAAVSYGNTRAFGLTVADLNGDGKLDVISGESSSGAGVNVFLGNGDGTLRAPVSYFSATGGQPLSVAAGDLNGDGKLDVVFNDSINNQAQVLIGNGDGTFKAVVSYQTGAGTDSVALADLNGDGKLDLVSADTTDGTTSVLLGNGDGTFKARATFQTGTSPETAIVADISGDGIPDIVTSDYGSNTVSILVGNGDGSFKARTSYQTAGAGPFGIGTGDFNGDGKTDLVTRDKASSGVDIFTAQGAGLYAFSLLSQQSSRQALSLFDTVVPFLTAALGEAGANGSRLRAASAVLQTTRLNDTEAASRILDVDVASEAANLARESILQQAGAAILAQANQQPALALRLLQDVR